MIVSFVFVSVLLNFCGCAGVFRREVQKSSFDRDSFRVFGFLVSPPAASHINHVRSGQSWWCPSPGGGYWATQSFTTQGQTSWYCPNGFGGWFPANPIFLAETTTPSSKSDVRILVKPGTKVTIEAEARMDANDSVVIDGNNTNARHSEAVKLLTGPEREVTLTIEREMPVTTVAPSVDPRTGKRFSYFAEPNKTNVAAPLRPSLSADLLPHGAKPALTLPAAWSTRKGIPERVKSTTSVTERFIESEKIERASLSGSEHDLRPVSAKDTAKPRTKSVHGTTMTTVALETLVYTDIVTERDVSPSKVNRKLQISGIVSMPFKQGDGKVNFAAMDKGFDGMPELSRRTSQPSGYSEKQPEEATRQPSEEEFLHPSSIESKPRTDKRPILKGGEASGLRIIF